jgi:hypothetical protein
MGGGRGRISGRALFTGVPTNNKQLNNMKMQQGTTKLQLFLPNGVTGTKRMLPFLLFRFPFPFSLLPFDDDDFSCFGELSLF